ncbi:MAG TPA: hypothetical protein VKE24_01740 [Candidatus Acidoferrales bacterium]|nr:hypothetical protein [Candidatus Acidoferrales bacterium]
MASETQLSITLGINFSPRGELLQAAFAVKSLTLACRAARTAVMARRQEGNDQNEPDMLYERDSAILGIEVATAYYVESDANQEWTLVRCERQFPKEGYEMRKGGVIGALMTLSASGSRENLTIRPARNTRERFGDDIEVHQNLWNSTAQKKADICASAKDGTWRAVIEVKSAPREVRLGRR